MDSGSPNIAISSGGSLPHSLETGSAHSIVDRPPTEDTNLIITRAQKLKQPFNLRAGSGLINLGEL